MNDYLKINTDRVLVAAANIDKINQVIENDFIEVENAMKSLDNFWSSAASLSARDAFYSIKDAYVDRGSSWNRYNIINNYTIFLRQNVDEGYTQVENINKALSEAFK